MHEYNYLIIIVTVVIGLKAIIKSFEADFLAKMGYKVGSCIK